MAVADLIKAQRPFPHDPHASYEVCRELYQVEVNTFEELTPEGVRAHVLRAAAGYRSIAFCIETLGETPPREVVGKRFTALHQMLRELLPYGCMFATSGPEVDCYQVGLYEPGEYVISAEKEARFAAVLARMGTTEEELTRPPDEPTRN